MNFPKSQLSWLFPVLYIIGNVCIVTAEDPSCHLINYDVENLTKASYWEVDYSGKTGCLEGVEKCKFYFSMCKPLPIVLTTGPRCANSAVCLEVPPEKTPGNATYLGIGNHAANPFQGEYLPSEPSGNPLQSNPFSADTQFWARYPLGQTYKKPDGSTCTTSTILHFICDKSHPWSPNPDKSKGSKVPGVTKVTYVPQTCSHVISMPYAGACSRAAQPIPPQGMSTGSVLIIMFICAMSVYWIGGISYNHCQGAQGKEMLPHLTFWEDLPTNIKAGFTLTRQVVLCQEIPTQSPTYEQL